MRWKWAAACVIAMLPPFRLLDAQTPSLQEARSLLDSGKLSEAEATVRKYLDTDQRSPDAHELLGYILFKEDNPKPSLAEYADAGRYRAPDAVALEVIGCDYFLMEDYATADKWLTQSLAQNRKNALALYFLGRTKYNEKHFEEAIALFHESLANGGKNVKTEENLGLSYERLGKTEEALSAYRAAVTLDAGATTHDPGPYLDLGTLLNENNQAGEAIQYLKDAIQYGPSDARAHQELGKAYLLTNQLELAQTELTKAAQLDPQNAPVHFLLAQVYRKQGAVEQARLESERYSKLTAAHSSPDDPLSAVRSLIESGKLAEAERGIRQYLEVHKNSADAHFLLGYIFFKEQNAKDSLAEYTEGAKYRTPSARDLEVVGGDYVLLQDFSDADKWFTKSVEWDPGNFQTLYYLGRTKYNENRFDEAVAVFEKCLQLDPR
ncbi:MAG: tetratricopeptide repeat protein, partial [Acidobacteriaceae bacterium]|nr:tetratricopeptide repeat protein [Acidobacteriaceae bacterium]